jgi:hypothetical protein
MTMFRYLYYVKDNLGTIKIQEHRQVPPGWAVLGKFKVEMDYEEQLQIQLMEQTITNVRGIT